MASTDPTSARVDAWVWAVRLFKTRSLGAAACRAGHVRVNGASVKAAYQVKIGDELRVRAGGRDRIVVVTRLVAKRVGASVATECYIDKSPPAPARELLAAVPTRDRGAGRPTKRDRREIDRLRREAAQEF